MVITETSGMQHQVGKRELTFIKADHHWYLLIPQKGSKKDVIRVRVRHIASIKGGRMKIT